MKPNRQYCLLHKEHHKTKKKTENNFLFLAVHCIVSCTNKILEEIIKLIMNIIKTVFSCSPVPANKLHQDCSIFLSVSPDPILFGLYRPSSFEIRFQTFFPNVQAISFNIFVIILLTYAIAKCSVKSTFLLWSVILCPATALRKHNSSVSSLLIYSSVDLQNSNIKKTMVCLLLYRIFSKVCFSLLTSNIHFIVPYNC